ncbi:putative membrane protein [Chitinophaga niastensis]|uniref:Putative membrane protein n=1 Tax=Chitinophaga niastensis TaxID=536980 RepID=A0A2P8HK69_CHINA|nr:DoxX family protein [Chitinophaga niastensis]PSL46618.1 putative membrane protein [Chitinophaga niastensis]
MAFFSGLCSIGLLLLAIGYIFHIPTLQLLQNDARISAAVMFLLIGFFHIAKPRKLTYMIEGMLPAPNALVIFTGVLELLLGAGLLFPLTKHHAGWGLIILLIALFPANIRVAVKQLPPPGGLPAKPWYTWSRLLFQPVYILWIWWAIQ